MKSFILGCKRKNEGGAKVAKRIEIIYDFFVQESQKATKANRGWTTAELANELNLQRPNVSRDLNELVRQGRLLKLDGRPVTYFIANATQNDNLTQMSKVPPVTKYVPSYKEAVVEKQSIFTKNTDVFTNIIGINGSMKNAGEQAKAAILYPPKGLNCLITGPTGSGKTFFAHAMFQFARQNQVIAPEKEMIVFNCADYAHNPELLMSHLFGYEKGAFTGADQAKAGIIEEANESMLFLDEIHRLPPEGQEMIFYFMDHGRYSRLGESGKNRQADVRIIGATTENPTSALLGTFLRRIPITIQLPSFEERPDAEKVDLVKIMIAQEARRIERTISLTEDVVKSLIGGVTFGNIGQLKSNVQLVCARGFLNHMYQDQIEITIDDVPEGIRMGLIQIANQRQTQGELAKLLSPKMTIQPDDSYEGIQTDSYELPYNLYDIIGDKAALLKAEGVDQEAIHHFISTDINVHLKSFYKNHGFSFQSESKLSEFVDAKVIELTNIIYQMVQQRFGNVFQQNFLYAMSLHISSFLKKIQLGDVRYSNDNIREMVDNYPEELAMAHDIRLFIADYYQIDIPQAEEDYLAVLLISLRTSFVTGKIGIVVATHGDSTASSMVEVVKKLLEVDHIVAVDMPLDMSPKIAFDKVVTAVKQVNQNSGVLLLVDMGSLATFQDRIQRETGITVRTLDMVTTPSVLEAARKASVLGNDLETIYDSLHNFRGYGQIDEKQVAQHKEQTRKPKAILAICASGEGTAKQVKEIIEDALKQHYITDVTVFTLAIVELANELPKLLVEYEVIASTGVVDPKIDAPFVSLERFINADIHELIDSLFFEEDLLFDAETLADSSDFSTEEIRKQTCQQFISETVTFLNPEKVIDVLWQLSSKIVEQFALGAIDYSFHTNFSTHCASMLERTLLAQNLSITKEEHERLLSWSEYPWLHEHIQRLGQLFALTIPSAEEYFIAEMIRYRSEN